MVNPTGYTALDLIGFTDKGTYAANVNYVKNDLVHYGGNIWKVLVDDTIGITPAEGTSYTLFIGEPTNLVERIIAPLEENPATIAYETGRQIIYNNYLYEVIDDIAVGDTLVTYEDDPTNANIKLASPVETQVLALKADKVNKSDIANNVTTTAEGKVLDARQGKVLQDEINNIDVIPVLVITKSSISSLPQTVTDAKISANHVVINSVLSNPSAQTGDWTVTTSAGSLTISGSISGTTDLTLYLAKGNAS